MPVRTDILRYAIYTRQSADTPADFSSCDAQFAVCSDFAKETGEPGLTWCGQHLDDQGYSGATLERPGLRRLRKVIDLGGVQRVYAVALDRLSRRLHDRGKRRTASSARRHAPDDAARGPGPLPTRREPE